MSHEFDLHGEPAQYASKDRPLLGRSGLTWSLSDRVPRDRQDAEARDRRGPSGHPPIGRPCTRVAIVVIRHHTARVLHVPGACTVACHAKARKAKPKRPFLGGSVFRRAVRSASAPPFLAFTGR